MDETLTLGLVQMTSTNRHEGNIAFATQMVEQAASKGCDLVAFPEVAGMMNRRLAAERELLTSEENDPFILACRRLASEHGVWIHTGSTPIAQADDERFLNHSNLISDTGEIVAAYDKIHLFDMYPDDAPPMLESKRYAPGQEMALAETPWGLWAMTVCYDLRFPQLYRAYAQAGAALIFVPSAFTVPTGSAHWEVLLRARAIECGAFVVAAAQVGVHDDGRTTYGHGMVVDPWGRVLADMEETVGLSTVELDLSKVAVARAAIPALTHDRRIR